MAQGTLIKIKPDMNGRRLDDWTREKEAVRMKVEKKKQVAYLGFLQAINAIEMQILAGPGAAAVRWRLPLPFSVRCR